MKLFLVVTLIMINLFASDIALYKELKSEVVKQDSQFHTDGTTKVLVKAKDTNLTKKVKSLLKKDSIAKNTKKYEKILKK